MQRFLLIAALALVVIATVLYCTDSSAQPQPDARVDAYRQLLTEANDRIASLSAQAAALQTQVQSLTKQLEDAKKPAETKP